MRYLLAWLLLGVLASTGYAEAPTTPGNAVMLNVEEVSERGLVGAPAALASAGQPDAAAFVALARAGYAAVIDLRTATEDRGLDEPMVVEDLGMRYVSLPIDGGDAINFENAARLDELIASLDGPVVVHCSSGNRVGALLALRQSLTGADDETAIAAGKAAGLTRLEPVVRKRLSEN